MTRPFKIMDTLSHMIRDLTCSLCSEPYGNAITYDAFPVLDEGKCCGDCFLNKVMPARIDLKALRESKKRKEEAERLRKEQESIFRRRPILGNRILTPIREEDE